MQYKLFSGLFGKFGIFLSQNHLSVAITLASFLIVIQNQRRKRFSGKDLFPLLLLFLHLMRHIPDSLLHWKRI